MEIFFSIIFFFNFLNGIHSLQDTQLQEKEEKD